MARGKSVNLFYYIDKDVLKDSLFEKMLKDKALEHHRFQEVEKSMDAMLYSIPDYQDFLKELVAISEPLQPKHLSIHKALSRLRDQVPEAFGYADAREDVSTLLSFALTSDAPLSLYEDALKVLRSPEALAYGSFEQKERLEEELQEVEVALVLAAIDE